MSEDTPEAVPAKPEEKVGKDGKLYLPVPHPLVESPTEDSWGAKINALWRAIHFFLRGLYGTAVEWGVSWMDLALEYPRVALVFIVMFGVVAEETMAKHPMLANTFKYVMFTMDEDAAKRIFPPEADPMEAEAAIDKMAAEIIQRGARDYYESPEYKQLELNVRANMHKEVIDSIQRMSGMEPLAPELVSDEPNPPPKKFKEIPEKVGEPIEEER